MKPEWGTIGGLLTGLLLAGCTGKDASDSMTQRDWAAAPFDRDSWARLDAPTTRLHSSHDITGGNDDWSSRINAPGEEEWVTLADLRGPGVMTRLWMTGWSDYEQRLRFYFDDEPTPRIDTDILGLFTGSPPFSGPYAAHENLCAWNIRPLPYAKRLVVQIQRGPDPGRKTYFHLQETVLPPDSTIESFQAATAGHATPPPPPKGAATARQPLASGPNTLRIEGPGRVVALHLDLAERPAPGELNWLREAELKAYWDEQSIASIHLPLGDTFGQMGVLAGHRSLGTSLQDNRLSLYLPMPFSTEARFEVVLPDAAPKGLTLTADYTPGSGPGPHEGYLHGFWHLSREDRVGPPHTVAAVQGRGRLIGCWLAADSSAIRSFWGLEGDESIFVDDAIQPVWQGTGLEDYFNGGWYYQAVVDHPLTGLLARHPHKTIQYRWHTADAVTFEKNLRFQFERGGKNRAPMRMESVAWLYLDTPQQAPGLPTASWRRVPDPAAIPQLAFARLLELERLGDVTGAEALSRNFPGDAATAEWLRLRDWVRRWQTGQSPGEVPTGFSDPLVSEWAGHFHSLVTGPAEALLLVSSRAAGEVWWQGESIGTLPGGGTAAWPIRLDAAGGVAGFTTTKSPSDSWLNILLLTREGHAAPDTHWFFKPDPASDWAAPITNPDATWSSYRRCHFARPGVPDMLDPVAGLLSRTANLARPVPTGARRIAIRGRLQVHSEGLFQAPAR